MKRISKICVVGVSRAHQSGLWNCKKTKTISKNAVFTTAKYFLNKACVDSSNEDIKPIPKVCFTAKHKLHNQRCCNYAWLSCFCAIVATASA